MKRTLEMELVVVALAILAILLRAKSGSSKRSNKLSKDDNLDEDTIYGWFKKSFLSTKAGRQEHEGFSLLRAREDSNL